MLEFPSIYCVHGKKSDYIECYMFSNQQTFLPFYVVFTSITKQLTQLWKCFKELKNHLSKMQLKLGAFMNSISGINRKITDRNFTCVLFLETNKIHPYYISCLIIHKFEIALLMQQIWVYKPLSLKLLSFLYISGKLRLTISFLF